MGFIEKRNGRYRARYRDPLGRQRSKTLRRRADAQQFLVEMESAKSRGAWIDPTGAKLPLADWAEEFMRLCRTLAPTTQDTYRRDLDKYVLPRFGEYRIGVLPADEIENWLNDEIDRGIAPSSVHRHYRTLRRALQVAVDKHMILQNPCSRVDPPRVPSREMVFLDWGQASDLAEELTERFRALIYFAVDAGMRWSELVGLRRSRLDVDRRKVRVTEQLVQRESREWVRKEPKTPASVRSISLSPFTAALLKDHLEHFATSGPDGLVFPNRPAIRSTARASGTTTSRPPCVGPASGAGSTTCAIHQSHSPSPRVPTPRRSKPAWDTRRSTSRLTATATCSQSSTRRSRPPSATV